MSKDLKKRFTDVRETDGVDLGACRQVRGSGDAAPHTFGIVVSRFNPDLTENMLRACVDALRARGARDESVAIAWVPGAFEIPSVLERWAASARFSALIALGVVIQGETPHAEAIGREIAHAFCSIARAHRVPVIDGVIIAHTMEQAAMRAGAGIANRGAYAAKAAVEMAGVFTQLET